jgi:hypothetical protein
MQVLEQFLYLTLKKRIDYNDGVLLSFCLC